MLSVIAQLCRTKEMINPACSTYLTSLWLSSRSCVPCGKCGSVSPSLAITCAHLGVPTKTHDAPMSSTTNRTGRNANAGDS